MDSLLQSLRLKSHYLQTIPQNQACVLQSILTKSGKYEKLYGVPLHHFSESQYQSYLKEWSRKSTFFVNRNRVGKYLEWLELQGIPTTISSFRNIKYSGEQIENVTRQMFCRIEDIYSLIYRIYFFGEGSYSSKIQEGTALLLRTIGLNNCDISELEESNVDYIKKEICVNGKIIHEIPEKFLELINICANLKGRYSRSRSLSKTVNFESSPYLLKQIKATEKRNAVFTGNMLKRAMVIWRESRSTKNLTENLFPKDLNHAYLFCKVLSFEQGHPDQIFDKISKEKQELASRLVGYWTGSRLSGATMQRYFLEEYFSWRVFACRE